MKDITLLWILTSLIILLGIFRACLGFDEPWVLKLKDLKPKHPDDKEKPC